MAKQINKIAKIQLIGGQAKPGPALAGIGINMGQFIKDFNEATKDRNGETVPCVITAYTDKSFDFVMKIMPTSELIKRALNLKAGASVQKNKVGKITKAQIEQIAKTKMPDLNTTNIESAMRAVAGTARNMGIEVEMDLAEQKARKGNN